MITSLAKSRIKYNKSRTILTAIAIMLTTMLLMGLGTSAVGLLDFNRQQASASSNVHAVLKNLTAEQVNRLKNHVDVESLETSEIFATVEYGRMNGFLTYTQDIKSGIYHGIGTLIDGRYAKALNEICGPKAFFKRLDTEPVIGNTVTISFRPEGEGKIETRDFVICGIVSEREVSNLDISDTRIAYGASVSEELVNEFIPQTRGYIIIHLYELQERIIPQEVYDSLNLNYDSTAELFISVDKNKYESVKTAMQEIEKTNEYFRLYSYDEEIELGAASVNVVKYPMYAILLMIAVIGFMNLINTMVTSIITRKRELGVLQAIGLSNKQLTKMLAGEGMVIIAGTLLASVTLGNILGYLIFLWAKNSHFMSVSAYHYPLMETIALASVLVIGQLLITYFINKCVNKESLIDRIRNGE